MFCFLALHIHIMSTISIKHEYIYEKFVLFHINLSVEDLLNSEVCHWDHRADNPQTTESRWQIIQMGWNQWQAEVYPLHRPRASSAQSEHFSSSLEAIVFHCIFWFLLSISGGIIWHCAHSSCSRTAYLMSNRSWPWTGLKDASSQSGKAESGSFVLVLLESKGSRASNTIFCFGNSILSSLTLWYWSRYLLQSNLVLFFFFLCIWIWKQRHLRLHLIWENQFWAFILASVCSSGIIGYLGAHQMP